MANSLYGFGQQVAWKEGVELQRLWERVRYLEDLLREEFTLEFRISSYSELLQVLASMQERGFLQIEDDRVRVAS